MNTTDDIEQFANQLIVGGEQENTETEADETEVTEETQPEAEDVDTALAEAEDTEAETDEPDEESDVLETPATYRVKVDGQEMEVTLDELTRSYSGQAYIQKGMQEAAAARKEAEAFANALQAEQQRVLTLAQQLQTEGVMPMPKAPPAELAKKDPIKYMNERADYEAKMEQFNRQQGELKAVSEAQQRLSQEQMAAQLRMAEQELMQRVPEFSNPEKAESLKVELARIGTEAYGYSPEELNAIVDPRAVHVLHDAMKYRQLQASTAKAKAEKKPLANVKPKAKQAEPAQLVRGKQLAQARKSGKLEDFAAALIEPR